MNSLTTSLALLILFGLGVFTGWRLSAASQRLDDLILSSLEPMNHREPHWDDEEWWAAK